MLPKKKILSPIPSASSTWSCKNRKIHIHEGTWESNFCLGIQLAPKTIGNQ